MLFTLLLLSANLVGGVVLNTEATASPQGARTASAEASVAADWAGPVTPLKPIELNGQEFNPELGLLGSPTLCVTMPDQPIPNCAENTSQSLRINSEVFDGSNNPDATCQSVETIRTGKDGRPERVFATVCGEAWESWSYRQRATPASRNTPTRGTKGTSGPNVSNSAIPELSN
jgi:hypothetical protein